MQPLAKAVGEPNVLEIIREFKFAGLQSLAFYNEIFAGVRNEIKQWVKMER